MDKTAIMVFGVGELQKSIISRAKAMNLFVVGIDPCEDAFCKDDVDVFEIVGGQDYTATIEVAKKYSISAIVTAATDKPLFMMARVGKALNLPFYSEDTARWSTDKFQMKQRFWEGDVPCAKGCIIHNVEEATNLIFPVICKPRDNSGSRGVKFCQNIEELEECVDEALYFSKLDTVLVEEFIEGQEYSIESLHYDGKSEVIQITEKKTTEFPYNVELGHKQNANLSEEQRNAISGIIARISCCLHFNNCPSHTELKINDRGIFIIETSPRLGGDYITSVLTPLSTGVNIEDQVIRLALGQSINTKEGRREKASGICFFSLTEGKLEDIDTSVNHINRWNNMIDFNFKLKIGDEINKITSSLSRYGYFIVQANTREEVDAIMDDYERKINSFFKIKK